MVRPNASPGGVRQLVRKGRGLVRRSVATARLLSPRTLYRAYDQARSRRQGESILAEVPDRPGGMATLARALADAGVNILGHLFLGRWGDRAMFAFIVDDPATARPILERKG